MCARGIGSVVSTNRNPTRDETFLSEEQARANYDRNRVIVFTKDDPLRGCGIGDRVKHRELRVGNCIEMLL